ncbi:MAG: aminoglycoside adenylyltransferase family protein [Chloroflexota bacterium]
MTQVNAILRLVRGILGDDLVGAYLHGSAVLGQLRPRSDTDVLIVSRRRLAESERRTLVEGLMDISGRRARIGGPARPIELTIVVQSESRPWRYRPRSEFQYGEWLRDDYERGVLPAPGESPDLAAILSMVLLGDRPIAGPPPAEVLDPVPREDLVRAVAAGIPGLLDDLESDTANVVLTLARIWATVATGALRAKDAAADWALERLPPKHRPVLERARAIYLGEIGDEDMTDLWSQVPHDAEYVVREIERALAGTPNEQRPNPLG